MFNVIVQPILFVLVLFQVSFLNCGSVQSGNSSLPLPPVFLNYLAKLKSQVNDYGLIEIRPGAKMFWWLFFADGDRYDAYSKPLIIWIQGGPGTPASGVGTFWEIGPFTHRLLKREYTWVKGRNVLFMDSPVGTGYSTVNSTNLLCKTDKEIAADLVELLKKLFEMYPNFKHTPVHIFSQSYGTRIAAHLAYYLNKKIKNGSLEMKLKSIGLGSSWISPKESMLSYPDFLYQSGFSDQAAYESLKNHIHNNLTKMLSENRFKEALDYRNEFITKENATLLFNVYQSKGRFPEVSALNSLMNSIVRFYLAEIGVGTWKILDWDVFGSLSNEIMRSAEHIVEKILNETDIKVSVYNGNFDSSTPIAGAVSWVHKLKWHGKSQFRKAKKSNLCGESNGFFKEYKNLSFWWILKSGHYIPRDNPEAMEQILHYAVDGKEIVCNQQEEHPKFLTPPLNVIKVKVNSKNELEILSSEVNSNNATL